MAQISEDTNLQTTKSEHLIPRRTPTRQYTVKVTNFKRSLAALQPSNHSGPAYEAHLSYSIKDFGTSTPGQHSVTLYSTSTHLPSPNSIPTIIGAGDINLTSLECPIRLCFDDPDLKTSEWHTMPARKQSSINSYELSVDSSSSSSGSASNSVSNTEQGGGRTGGKLKTYHWKRTHEGEGIGPIARKLDWLNLKMESLETGEVVARFVHHPWYGWKRGYFEIFKEEGDDRERWGEIVLLSGMTVLEYQRKITGWSW